MADITPSLIASLSAEAERIEEDSLYSSKGHFEAARRWDLCNLGIGTTAALAAAAAGISVLRKDTVISALLAFLSASSSALLTFLNPRDRAGQHLKAGNLYKALHNDSRIFRQIDCQGQSQQDLSSSLKALNTRRNALNSEAPQVPRSAFRRARKGIEQGEATYKADRP